MSYADLRKGRSSSSGQVYLATTVTRDRNPVFRGFQAGRLLVAEMRRLPWSRTSLRRGPRGRGALRCGEPASCRYCPALGGLSVVGCKVCL